MLKKVLTWVAEEKGARLGHQFKSIKNIPLGELIKWEIFYHWRRDVGENWARDVKKVDIKVSLILIRSFKRKEWFEVK